MARFRDRRNELLLQRASGWPIAAGILLLLMAALVDALVLVVPQSPHVKGHVNLHAYIHEVAVVIAISAALLLLWRRGVIIDRAAATVTRWWGLAGFGGPLICRRSTPRSLDGFSGVRALRTCTVDHYKKFRHDVFHVQLEKSESSAGQFSLRERIIVDDEIPTPNDAVTTGRRLADFLSIDLIDRTSRE